MPWLCNDQEGDQAETALPAESGMCHSNQMPCIALASQECEQLRMPFKERTRGPWMDQGGPTASHKTLCPCPTSAISFFFSLAF